MRVWFITVLYCISFLVSGQSLSSKSNAIRFSLENGPLPTVSALPKINWISPTLDFSNSAANHVEIEFAVESFRNVAGVKLILLSNGGTDTLGVKNLFVNNADENLKYKQRVYLPNGTNLVSVDVSTKQGISLTDKRTVYVGADAEDKLIDMNRKDYALIFATDKYDHWDDLVNPIDDSYAISKELQEKYGFEVELVQNPTMEKVFEKLREYNERVFNPQDQLLIFFAGHGHYDDSFGEGFVVAKNSRQNDLSRASYISHNRLRGVIGNIPCKHILLTMDVCFGGTLDPVIARARGAKENEVSVNELIVRKLRYRTRKYITSGGKEYVSDGVPGKHSPFAAGFIEALRSRGGEDFVLTLAELQSYLEKLRQQPRMGSFSDDETLSDFIFVSK